MMDFTKLNGNCIVPAGTQIYVGNDILHTDKDIRKHELEKSLYMIFGKDIKFLKAKGVSTKWTGMAISHMYYAYIEKKKPIYQFGDKILHDSRRALFLEYVNDSQHEAWIFYEGGMWAMRAQVDELITI